jgi:crotonobetainyl-CoA:carnitine CoA-transferase CaiB-like acyl-CoA transferase
LAAADGYVLVAPTSQRIFERLAVAIDRTAWLSDERFSMAERDHHWELLLSGIEEWTAQRSARECEETLLAAEVPCSRYRETADAMDDPQLAHRGSLATVIDGAGPFVVSNLPYRMSVTPPKAGPAVAQPGADGTRILRDHLGCSEDEITAWRCSGALGAEETES